LPSFIFDLHKVGFIATKRYFYVNHFESLDFAGFGGCAEIIDFYIVNKFNALFLYYIM